MEGWIKLYRNLLNSCIFENEKLLKVFIWCLLKATHKEREVLVGRQLVKLKPGQFVFGRNKAALELKLKPTTLWAYILTLKNKESIDIISNNKYSVITVVNWELYQSEEEKTDSNSANKRTTNGQQTDTNKNVKKDKNNNIYIIANEQEKELLSILSRIKNYPFDEKTDLEMIQRLKEKYPTVDFKKVFTDYEIFVMGKPIKKGDNPRSRINTFCKNAEKWQKEKWQKPELQTPVPKQDDYMEEAFRRRMMQNANTTP